MNIYGGDFLGGVLGGMEPKTQKAIKVIIVVIVVLVVLIVLGWIIYMVGVQYGWWSGSDSFLNGIRSGKASCCRATQPISLQCNEWIRSEADTAPCNYPWGRQMPLNVGSNGNLNQMNGGNNMIAADSNLSPNYTEGFSGYVTKNLDVTKDCCTAAPMYSTCGSGLRGCDDGFLANLLNTQ